MSHSRVYFVDAQVPLFVWMSWTTLLVCNSSCRCRCLIIICFVSLLVRRDKKFLFCYLFFLIIQICIAELVLEMREACKMICSLRCLNVCISLLLQEGQYWQASPFICTLIAFPQLLFNIHWWHWLRSSLHFIYLISVILQHRVLHWSSYRGLSQFLGGC